MDTKDISRGELFEDKYRQLETVINQKFGDLDGSSPIYYLIHKKGYEEYASKLECCREIRNLITHFPKEKGAFPIEPSAEMINLLDEIIYKLSNRAKCRNLAIPFEKMYCRTMEDSVTETITMMRKRAFTYVPIVKGRKVIGIFDENSLFCCLADRKSVDLKNMKLADISNYIGLENREMEVFEFYNKFMYLDELKEEFRRLFDKGKRLGTAFITENGDKNEDVISMLTAWDVVGM